MSSQTRSSQGSNARAQKDITEIPMVRKFQDVFPDELPGLPPHREFDFFIEYIAMGSPSVVCEEEGWHTKVMSGKDLLMYLRLEFSWGWLDIIGVESCDASTVGLGCVLMQQGKEECWRLSSLELREFEMHAVIEDFELCLGLEGHGEIDENWSMYEDGSVRFKGRLYVPKDVELRNELLADAHRAKYTIHPGNTKMYQDLKRQFWWSGMKRDIAQFVANCQICQQVKAEHQRPAGLLQPLPIPEWKWDNITMDFVIGLPRTRSKKNGVWVIVDRLTKSTHFLAMKTTDSMNSLAKLLLTFGEFAYNNDYQSSIGMAPYEALYERPCRSPLCWIEMGESRLLGPEIIDRKVMLTKGEGPWSLRKGIGKCTPDPTWVVDLQNVQISENTSYVEEPLRILEVGEIGSGTR
ncbi:hypothetical protein AAG906_035545 [Vitis piasezkii]